MIDDDWAGDEVAAHAVIGNREGAAFEVTGFELVCFCAARNILKIARDLKEALGLCVFDNRYNLSLIHI